MATGGGWDTGQPYVVQPAQPPPAQPDATALRAVLLAYTRYYCSAAIRGGMTDDECVDGFLGARVAATDGEGRNDDPNGR